MNDKQRETKHFIWAISILLIIVMYTINANTLESKILWTVQDSGQGRLYGKAESTKAYTDSEYRTELSNAFKAASERFNLPVALLVSVAYFETIYRNLRGDKGKSLGIMQVGIQGRRACKCDMSTVEGQIMCGACWLDKGRQWCGNVQGGLSAYACGKCKPVNVASKRAVARRVRLWKELEK